MVLSGYAFARIDGVSTGVDIANLRNCHGYEPLNVAPNVAMSLEIGLNWCERRYFASRACFRFTSSIASAREANAFLPSSQVSQPPSWFSLFSVAGAGINK
jgi:hypothetical protein